MEKYGEKKVLKVQLLECLWEDCELNTVSTTCLPGRMIPFCLPFQVLDVIAPPYTSDFVQLFLPILENESIAGTIKTEGEHDPVTEFIGKSCFFVYLLLFVNNG